MRRVCMGRARKYPGGPNILGSDGTHVREVPKCRADRKSCEIGHVAPAAGLCFLVSASRAIPDGHDVISGRLVGTRGD